MALKARRNERTLFIIHKINNNNYTSAHKHFFFTLAYPAHDVDVEDRQS